RRPHRRAAVGAAGRPRVPGPHRPARRAAVGGPGRRTGAGARVPGGVRPLGALRADPGFLGRTDRPDALQSVAPDGVRERLLGYLLVTARGMAMEAAALPEVIGEHLGIVDPVTAAML